MNNPLLFIYFVVDFLKLIRFNLNNESFQKITNEK